MFVLDWRQVRTTLRQKPGSARAPGRADAAKSARRGAGAKPAQEKTHGEKMNLENPAEMIFPHSKHQDKLLA